MKEYLLIRLIRLLLRVFYVFPVKKRRVVLTAYNGRQFACSPKYIALALRDKGGFEVIYALTPGAKDALPEGVTRVKYRSLRHFYDLMTAEYIVVNSTGLSGMLPYRKGQTLIDTWHGAAAFKSIDNSADWSRYHRAVRRIMGRNTDVFLSSCPRASEHYSRALAVDLERFSHIGLPRNDLFFRETPELRTRVCRALGVDPDKRLALYAPTFRDGPLKSVNGYGFEPIHIEGLIAALNRRFGGEFVFLFKAHHDTLPENIGENCVNCSAYSDIQELLYAADVLITDYSSCMWDFALRCKPAFLYTPDLEQYGTFHTFAIPVEKWPYETACTNEELLRRVADFDEAALRPRIEAFFRYMGGRDTGEATKKLLAQVIH